MISICLRYAERKGGGSAPCGRTPGTEGLTKYGVTCMVGKVEAPEKANMMEPKAVKKISINPEKFRILFTVYLDAITLERSRVPKSL